MQCHEMRFTNLSLLTQKNEAKPLKTEKESIHSGHFMVSEFDSEAQDDEDDVAVNASDATVPQSCDLQVFNVRTFRAMPPGQLAIETSLTKLFQCMSLAYRQKLTSPKWNRFKGIRLRWKDKIRLNNVIWRCWHMQFIKKENTLICQFASPLDEGTHNKPEAVVLEGKYWKRKLAAVTAEYKKWRMFYRNKIMGWTLKDSTLTDMDMFDCQSYSNDGSQFGAMMVDEDYRELISDTLFSSLTSNQPFAFPDTREIARGANSADFIQPSLLQLQPDLDDFMDTFEYFSARLPPVPEDIAVSDVTYRPTQSFPDLSLEAQASTLTTVPPQMGMITQSTTASYNPVISYSETLPEASPEIKTARIYHPAKSRFSPFVPNENVEASNVTQTYNFETEAAQSSSLKGGFATTAQQGATQRGGFATSTQQGAQQLPYKLTTATSQPAQVYKYPGYSKISPAPPQANPPQYNIIQQNYDLAVSSQHLSLPEVTQGTGMIKIRSSSLPSVDKDDVFAVPKARPSRRQQPLAALRNRQRTRSGSSLVAPKARMQPPPLSSASSDSALNVSSALLAQLLSSNNSNTYSVSNLSNLSGMSNAADRTQTAQPIPAKSTNIPILPMPPKILSMPVQSTLLITNPTFTSTFTSNQTFLNTVRPLASPESPPESSRARNAPSPVTLSQSPTSPLMFSGPLSPSKSQKQDGAYKSCPGPSEHRRVCHINAEQKRRFNIKNGFDHLHSLIPHLHQNPNVKLSKAAMLQKGAEYIRQLQVERQQVKDEMESLKYQIESLNTSIVNCQSLLPATGAPVSKHRTTKMKEMFDEFVRIRTLENWRFWIFSILFEPLLQSFNCSVSTASYEDLYRSTLIWVEQHCSLVDLRPTVLNSLRNLSTSTEILTDPSKLPEEARKAVSDKDS